ncbi:MAG: copper resistance protein B [Alphaproteobacteria bacterium]|nr:copper resistance protein B [Alphaproteobacteria bacterium]
MAQHAGHVMPQAPDAKQPATLTPQQPAPSPADHQGHEPQPVASPADPHAGHVGATEAVDPPEAGDDAPPDAPTDFAADAFFPRDEMVRARSILDSEHGGAWQSKIMANILEYQSQNGQDGYRWEGEAWFGGDINRLVIKTEGEGSKDPGNAEVQALYSRAIGPYTDVQLGVRHDIEPRPSRTYLAFGVQSLLPYWFDANAALFVGERGQILGRLEGSYDFLLTQRLALQPRVELNFAAKNDAATGTGSGLSDAELGLRLRYEIRREFAPYIGVEWTRSFGDTANFARATGDRAETTSFVVGLRAWY